tara:strand:- start:265 stop:549 length:285 start_codon:yes stop_codon:yes gene_type:complete
MFIDKKTVQKIAHLSRIKLNDKEQDKIAKELSNILGWMNKLKSLDLENVLPLRNVNEMKMIERKDTNLSKNLDNMLSNAPDSRKGYFAVPKVIE